LPGDRAYASGHGCDDDDDTVAIPGKAGSLPRRWTFPRRVSFPDRAWYRRLSWQGRNQGWWPSW